MLWFIFHTLENLNSKILSNRTVSASEMTTSLQILKWIKWKLNPQINGIYTEFEGEHSKGHSCHFGRQGQIH